MRALYTIGHSNHSIDAFVELLRPHGVRTVADVRSQPYSRWHPQFRRDALRASLQRRGIGYVFLGRELGARSEDPACLIDGRVDYARLERTAAFRAGLAELIERARTERVAVMCAEREPLDCHRTILVCRALAARTRDDADGPWSISHILADGSLETQDETDARLLTEAGTAPDLLRSRDEALEDAYRLRGSRMGWKKPRATSLRS